MRVRLAIAAFVNSVFIRMHMQANMAAGACRINMSILFTNKKLPSLHSESIPRSRSKASTYSYAEKFDCQHFLFFYASTLIDLGHIVFSLSVCPSVFLSVCLPSVTFTLAIPFDW